jgi:hypothetical protein
MFSLKIVTAKGVYMTNLQFAVKTDGHQSLSSIIEKSK